MKHLIIMIFAPILILIPFTFSLQAQNTLPPDYNFCSDPDVWGNGHCVNSDESIQTCMWEMGWYLPRVVAGEIDINTIDTPCLQVISDSENTTIEVKVEKTSNGCKTLVVVLNGSPYKGSADVNVDGDSYDGSGSKNCLEIHGNNEDNELIGSSNADVIYGYAGSDDISGGDGDDTLYGGDEATSDFDEEDEFDFLLLVECEGDCGCEEDCGCEDDCGCVDDCESWFEGTLGDRIDGGAGDDTIYGGDETCNAEYDCGGSHIGDVIDGGDGNDTIHGGNETCTEDADYCDDYYGITHVGDTITGGNGDDTIDGGDESCDIAGESYECGGNVIGDAINTNDGNDTVTGGDESCTGDGCEDSIVGDGIGGGDGDDTIDAEGGDNYVDEDGTIFSPSS